MVLPDEAGMGVTPNETTTTPLLAVFGYETGSDALAEELAFLEEGERGVPSGALPVYRLLRYRLRSRVTSAPEAIPGPWIWYPAPICSILGLRIS
jgi:hypothetical protein